MTQPVTLKKALEALKSVWGLITSIVASGPLAMWSFDLQPPWPSGAAVVALAASVVAVWLVLAVTTNTVNQGLLKWTSVVSLVLGLILGCFYFGASSRYIVSVDIPTADGQRSTRVVIGSTLRQGYSLNNKTRMDLLLDSQMEPAKVWTEDSIADVNNLLLGLFVGTFFFLTAGTTLVPFYRQS